MVTRLPDHVPYDAILMLRLKSQTEGGLLLADVGCGCDCDDGVTVAGVVTLRGIPS